MIKWLTKVRIIGNRSNQISSLEFIDLPALVVLAIGGVNRFKYVELKDLSALEEVNLAYTITETLKLINLPSLLGVDARNAKLNLIELKELPHLVL